MYNVEKIYRELSETIDISSEFSFEFMLQTSNDNKEEVINYLKTVIKSYGTKNTFRRLAIIDFFEYIQDDDFKKERNIYNKLKIFPFEISKPHDIINIICIVCENKDEHETASYILSQMDICPVFIRVSSLYYFSFSGDKIGTVSILKKQVQKNISPVDLYKTLCLLELICFYKSIKVSISDNFNTWENFIPFVYQKDYIDIELSEREDSKLFLNMVKGIKIPVMDFVEDIVTSPSKRKNTDEDYWITGIHNSIPYKIEQLVKTVNGFRQIKFLLNDTEYLILCAIMTFDESYLEDEFNCYINRIIFVYGCKRIAKNFRDFSEDFIDFVRQEIEKFKMNMNPSVSEIQMLEESYRKMIF